MANELMNLAGFKSGPAKAFAGHFTEESLADGIGGGYPLIRYGGKVWAIQIKGDETKYVTPDGYGAPYIDVVILRQARHKSKAYFPNWEEGSKDAPVCSSLDGVVPDPGVEERQNATCSGCPRNVFKPNEKGMKVKECSDAKRLAVFPLIPSHMLNATGGPVVEPTFLRVPAASLGNLAAAGDTLRKAGYDYFMAVIRIDFDPEKNYPKMRFRPHQALSEKEAEAVLKLREDPQAYRIISGELGGGMKTIGHEEAMKLAAPAGDTGLVQEHRETIVVDEKAELAAKLAADTAARKEAVRKDAAEKEAAAAYQAAEARAKAAAQAAQPVLELKANPTPPAETAPVDTGLGGLTTPRTTVQSSTQASQPVSSVDTGEAEPADALLDAAITKFLPPQS